VGAVLAALLVLAGCSPQPDDDREQEAGAQLERAAIAAGVVRDPDATDITGLYARDTDRVCIAPARVGYRIGASIDFGGGQMCSASGTVARSGGALRVDFGGDCTFEARLDGETIVFPGRLPAACDRLCTDRASLTALEAELQSDAVAEAATLRDTKGRALCGS
jgi:hypothetical protein